MFALDLRHLTERMFFARYAKHQHAERDSSHAVAEEKSHNALAQLSASGVARKTKALWYGATAPPSPGLRRAGRVRREHEHEQEHEQE